MTAIETERVIQRLQPLTSRLIPAVGLLGCAVGTLCISLALEQWISPGIQSTNLSNLVLDAVSEHADDVAHVLGGRQTAVGREPETAVAASPSWVPAW